VSGCLQPEAPPEAGRPASAPAPAPVVEFRQVSFAYTREPVLQEVSFEVKPGEFVSAVGPNGGGKTTLLRLILGTVRPDAGEVRVFGGPPERARSRVGYVPQYARFDPLFPVTVLDVVRMGRVGSLAGGPYRRQDREMAREALATVGLEELRRRPFSALSGGQRQRILIARALATHPELLLLDEPTASVDRAATAKLYELLVELAKRLTILLVSHDTGVVSQFVSGVLCVNRTVAKHPISRLTGEMLSELYGADIALVRHEHNL
jgi:zinc transport system ATP-binding protein